MNSFSSDMRYFQQKHCCRRSVIFFLCMVLFLTLPKLHAAPLFTGCGGEVIAATNTQAEAQMVELVNQERAKVGLPPYKSTTTLADAARYHAADMAADRYLEHDTHDRNATDQLVAVCAWNERIQKYQPSFNTLGENVGRSTDSAEFMLNMWMNSPSHRSNILGNYREMGVGYNNTYWAQDFVTQNTLYPLIINDEMQQTTTPTVSLYLYGNWTEVRLRNDGGEWSAWQPFQNELQWTLANSPGTRVVEAEMHNATTTVSSSDTITLSSPTPTDTPISTPTVALTLTPKLEPEVTPNPNPPLPSTNYLPLITQ